MVGRARRAEAVEVYALLVVMLVVVGGALAPVSAIAVVLESGGLHEEDAVALNNSL